MLMSDSINSLIKLQRRALVSAVVTVLILVVFQPFGTYESDSSYKLLKLAGYGVATFFAIIVAGVIEISVRRIKGRTKLHYVLMFALYITLTALFNHSYFAIAILGSWQWQNQLLFFYYVFIVALFPLTILYLLETRKPEKANGKESSSLATSSTTFQEEPNVNQVKIELCGDNKNDVVSTNLSHLVLLSSADNYCEVVTYNGDKLEKQLLRVPLTRAIEQLPSGCSVLRCHRSHAINLDFVSTSSGNANGMKLSVALLDTDIPVSRTYVTAVKSGLLTSP